MNNAIQQQKAEERRQQFSNPRREMFQLNHPELDFGLYRIMHTKKDQMKKK
jgi:adenine-specific DNA-methyltransferase